MADASKRTRTVRVATYNIHRGRGMDGRTSVERIAAPDPIDNVPDFIWPENSISDGCNGRYTRVRFEQHRTPVIMRC